MIASLPMYERAETVAAHDAFWSVIREELLARDLEAPMTLTRTNDPWLHWRSPELVLSQTCGLPFRSELHSIVNLVGTPDYGLADAPPGHYFSVFIARANDPLDDPAADPNAVMAVNDLKSQSGWAAPLDHLGTRPTRRYLTGSHLASARSVAKGQADWAALDVISWHGLSGSPELADRLRVFAKTRPTPGLPLITAGDRDSDAVTEAVEHALHHLDPRFRSDLGMRSIVRIPKEEYLAIPVPPAVTG